MPVTVLEVADGLDKHARELTDWIVEINRRFRSCYAQGRETTHLQGKLRKMSNTIQKKRVTQVIIETLDYEVVINLRDYLDKILSVAAYTPEAHEAVISRYIAVTQVIANGIRNEINNQQRR